MSHIDPYSFVQRTFPPIVGSLASPTVEQICQKNNLSFVEMIRPFCTVYLDQRLRDPSGNDHLIKTLQVSVQDVNDRPPQQTLARKFLNESVSNAICDTSKTVSVGNMSLSIPTECTWFQSWCDTFLQVQFPSDHEFSKHLLGCILVTSSTDPPETLQSLLQTLQQMQATAPARLPKWFSSTIFKYYVLLHDSKEGDKSKALNFFNSLKTAYGADQCFFLEINSQHQHELSSSAPDYWIHCIIQRNQDLDGSDHGSSPRTPAEMIGIGGMPSSLALESDLTTRAGGSPEMAQEAGELSAPVVLHPLSPDIEISHFNAANANQNQSNDLPKVVNANIWHGLNSNVQLGACLTNSDVENIKALIKHLVSQALLPHVEKLIFQLNDITSNKKGVSRSLLSATKRLFGSSKPGSPGSSPVNSVIYAFDAPELQLRRLGDLYFMFTNYSLAFQAYHSAKRDFGADQAWQYYAGALEMAALSAFMQGEVSKKGVEYMEEAIVTYLNSCRLPQFATRATLLSTLFLKDRQMFGEAAKQLIRMTSEDSDLRSALLLEQASYCFLYSTKPNMFRKYAFHMVLAGHRFSKAGQKKHALRCYKQAFQVYQNKGWSLAEDHIHFTIGRLAGNLKLSEGSSSLACLLSSGSKQTPAQQITYLREYLQMQLQLNVENPKRQLPVLPLPIVEDNSTRVLVSVTSSSGLMRAFEPDSPADSVRWSRMEELAVTESQGAPMIFRRTIHLFSKETLNNSNPVVVVNEPVYVQISLKNPLQIPLPLLRVRLLWKYQSADGKIIQNEQPTTVSESIIETNVLETVQIEPSCTQHITLSLIPLCPGQIDILGVHYVLTCPSVNLGSNAQQNQPPAVAGKQIFHVRGPKLKPKKDQPSTALYEEDKRLEIKIIQAAPLLKVEMESLKYDMLCGEMELTNVKLTNSGNAPLKNLYMTTSSPNLISLSNSYVASERIIQNSVVDNSIENDPVNEKIIYKIMKITLENNGILKPGQEIVLPLWVRAPDKKGSAQVDVLFYYENYVGNSAPKYRIARCSSEIAVHDSVQLSAIASRSTLCQDKDSMNIAVTVKNFNQTHDSLVTAISLVQISLASSNWKLQNKAICSKDLKLQSQESSYFLLRADRTSEKSVSMSDVSLCDKEIVPGNSQPYHDFYNWHIYDAKNESTANLFNIVLCLRWDASVTDHNNDTKNVTGQSHLTLNQLNVASVWPPDPKNILVPVEHVDPLKIFGPERKSSRNARIVKTVHLENALSYSLVHSQQVAHPFQTNRICPVKMKLILRNCIDLPVRIMVNSPGAKSATAQILKTQLYTPHSSSTFSWINRSNALIKLNGHDQTIVGLTAVFTSPGTYDLGSRLTISAATEDDMEFVNQLCRVESNIIVLEKISSTGS